MLANEEEEFDASETLLYAHRRLVATSSFSDGTEMRFRGTTVNELQQAIAQTLSLPAGGVYNLLLSWGRGVSLSYFTFLSSPSCLHSTENLFLAKFNPHNGKWNALELDKAGADSAKKNKLHVKDGGNVSLLEMLHAFN